MTEIRVEPTAAWQQQRHERILRQDATAFAELCETALPHLVAFLQQKFPGADPHLHENTAIDCLLAYHANPTQYDPARLPLFAYLRMATRYDMLTAVKQTHRQQQRTISLDDPAIESQLAQMLEPDDEQLLDEWLAEYTNESVAAILAGVDELLEEQEKQILFLMLEGERRTERYATLMGLADADVPTQQHEVKKVKDRINKKLRRFGNQLRQA
jgi:hypothetical protein